LSSAEQDAKSFVQSWSGSSRSSAMSSSASGDLVTITAEYAFDDAALDSAAYRRAFAALLKADPRARQTRASRRSSGMFAKLFKRNSSSVTLQYPVTLQPQPQSNETPSIKDINTAILMGANPEEIRAMLLRGDSYPDVNGEDEVGLSPIHMACLVPSGLYSHSPASTVDVLVASGARTEKTARIRMDARDDRLWQPIPYLIAAYTKNVAVLRSLPKIQPGQATDQKTWMTIPFGALSLACQNFSISGPLFAAISDCHPHLRTIYASPERMKQAAKDRNATLQMILLAIKLLHSVLKYQNS
jgi:hypothetical protein